jgi:hypothetical protein
MKMCLRIGISPEQTIPYVANRLRRLVVDEWTGQHVSEYQHFFIDTNIEREAPNFLRNGHFSSSFGDAMPLAMANVLQMSIFMHFNTTT